MRSIVQGMALALLLAVLAGCGSQPPQAASTPQAMPTAAAAGQSLHEISADELKIKLDAGEHLLLLDVRSAQEYQQDGHIAGTQLIPLPELEQRLGELPSDQPIVCICRSGNRSKTACNLLAQHGFKDVTSVQGGMTAWIAAGYPAQ